MSNKPKIIAIVGPTASGKTALGIALAKKFGGEIVSADSRQIYRGMDIGTAKPTAEERRVIPHHLIDIKDPDEDYTVADYKRDAIAAIDGIVARGNVPLLVGGTGLYMRAVLENLDIPKTVADPELRAGIEQDIARDGLEAAFKKLVALDPEAAYVVSRRIRAASYARSRLLSRPADPLPHSEQKALRFLTRSCSGLILRRIFCANGLTGVLMK